MNGDLPEGWVLAKASDLLKWSSGKFLPKSKQQPGDIPVFGGNGIAGIHNEPLVYFPTLVVGRVGALCGNVYRTEGPAWITDNAIYALALPAGVDLEYCRMIFSQAKLGTRAGGTGQPFVSQEILNSVEFPVAPEHEQRRIVAQIETLLAKERSSRERLNKLPSILRRFRRSVITAACNGNLTAKFRGAGIEERWRETNLGEVLTRIEAGRSFSCDERPPRGKEVGVLKISAVTWGEFDEDESKTCTDPALVKKEYLVRVGDLLMTRANTLELVGAVALVERISKRLMLSDKTLRLSADTGVSPRWILYWLRSTHGREQIEALATGNQQSMRNISQGSIRSITILIPPIEEQRKIESEVEKLLTVANAIEAKYHKAIAHFDKIEQSILAKAFRGELVPTESELAKSEGRTYETAEQLLARIKALPSGSSTKRSRGSTARA